MNPSVPIQRYFEEISQIPRNSREEGKIARYLMDFAQTRGLETWEDELHNVVIKKPGSLGCESLPHVMLQAHVDMVCVKTPGSSHDFAADPIELVVEGDILRAKDTSLGADDGFGVAYMLAILDDPTLKHPPLECLFTTQEENDCYGAEALDVSKLQGKRLISLDGCEDTNTYVSSFRSDLIKCEKVLRWAPASGKAIQVEVRDVSTNVYDGVSHQEQGNAVKILARLLRTASEAGASLRLFALEGGVAENIVPETATARFCYEGLALEHLQCVLKETFHQFSQELDYSAQAGILHVTAVPAPSNAVTAQDSKSLVDLLYLLPNNLFQAAAREITSICNLGEVKLEKENTCILLSTRSRHASAAEELLHRCHTLTDLTGFTFSTARRYEGWPYQKDSPLRALANQVTQDLFGYHLQEQVAAGGLEIAIFVKRIPGLDVLELGASHTNLHTVEESMELSSFQRIYTVLQTMLERMATQ